MSHSVRFRGVTFQYDGQIEPILSRITMQLSPGWTGVVGANGAGKTTILKLTIGLLMPVEGNIEAPDDAIYCPQRTDDSPDELVALLDSHDGTARMLMGRLKIETDWLDRWETLSHGERKRAQIGVALWRSPAVLAIDEPTNHLDLDARRLLENALAAFRGVGLLVSHDRALLDSLCRQTLFVDPPSAKLRPGGVSQGSDQANQEREYVEQQVASAKREQSRLRREASKVRGEASRADRRRSKRGFSAKDSDAREKINRARLTGKDGLAGKRLNQLDGRLQQVNVRAAKLAAKVNKQSELGISIPGARLRRDFLLRIPSGRIRLSKDRQVEHSDLALHPQDRIGLVGPNGSGKSTVIRHILEKLGDDQDLVTYLPQEICAVASSEILGYARSLSGELLGKVMTVVSRLGSEPQRLLNSEVPSPGEVRKLVLGLGISHASPFFILDEPTNHLDIPSIECVEAALREFDCGLLLVSHDERFLKNLTQTIWRLDEGNRTGVTQLKII